MYLTAIFASTFAITSTAASDCIDVKFGPPSGANSPLERFLSYSIEFSSFADFAGNASNPNAYSDNLLSSIAHYTGSKPLIRVGGNTQDLSTFNASQTQAVIQFFNSALPDHPANQTFGPAFFESYHTWPGVQFSHGFNLAENSTEARQALLDSVPYACRALRGKFNGWELGNEPDFFPGAVRPVNYTPTAYVVEWLEWSRKIRRVMEKACPTQANDKNFKFLAPSLAGFQGFSKFGTAPIFAAGLNADSDINYIAQHKYIEARGNPGITQQGTLMNHTNNIVAVANLAGISSSIDAVGATNPSLVPKVPFIIGESNSLARQGIGGVSNSFGAALWGLDYGLQLITQGIAWQPIQTRNTTIGTKAPFYGNIALSAFLGDLTNPRARPQIVDLGLLNDYEAAYASYVRGKLAKLIVINMNAYNATATNVGFITNYTRPVEKYRFQLPRGVRSVGLQRLLANGSDAITGVTFDGFSFAQELGHGRPVRLANITRGEILRVRKNGRVEVSLLRSSAVILNLD
nr:hypothetical protein B0A51_02573 [Rachicladosporium sp. CCFEE 5018]